MLNSAQDLDISSSSHVAKSTSHPSSLITELSIEPSPAMSIFTAATAQAIRLTDAPVAILTTIAGAGYQIGAISGMEQCQLPPHSNLRQELGGLEYCHDRAISGKSNYFSVTNCQKHPQLAQSSLCQTYGLRAYLGVPIITAAGDRLGTIAILDFKPRHFRDRDIDLLQLVSRLVASEFERKLLSQAQLNRWLGDLQDRSSARFDDPAAVIEHTHPVAQPHPELPVLLMPLPHSSSIAYSQVQSEIQFKLLTYLAQELRTPLTAVLGMASVLQQEIYGPLSSKQKDYLGIIHHSSRQLVTIVDEISQLGGSDFQQHQLKLKSVDLEMLCQLAIQSLEPLAQKKQQQIVLNLGDDTTPAMTSRMWLLDKDKVRQIVYYLCLSLIHVSSLDRQISIRCTNLTDGLQIELATDDPLTILSEPELETLTAPSSMGSNSPSPPAPNPTSETQLGQLRIGLGLSLSHSLAAAHGGKIEVTSDRRGYQLTLPLIIADRPMSAPI
jgi:signal transduction histidine kinase